MKKPLKNLTLVSFALLSLLSIPTGSSALDRHPSVELVALEEGSSLIGVEDVELTQTIAIYWETQQASQYFFCTHTDLVVEDQIWNFWGRLHKRGSASDKANWAEEGLSRPFYQIVLRVTDEELQSLQTYLETHEGISELQTCSRGLSRALSATTSLEMPELTDHSPLALIAHFKIRQHQGDPRIAAIEAVGTPSLCTPGVTLESLGLMILSPLWMVYSALSLQPCR